MAVAVTARPRTPGRLVQPGWPRILWIVGTVLLVTMVVHIVALLVTGGPWTGPVSLRKPATFAETGWLAAWSVALILPTLRTRAWERHVIGAATVLFGVGETAIIGIQAWRGVPSHYNFTTPLDAALMRGGAAGTAGTFLVGVIVALLASLRRTDPPTLASVRLGIRAGIAVLVAGCAIGLVMIFNNSGIYQGSVGAGFTRRTTGYLGPDPATVGLEYVLIRPFTAGGDLVLPHAIGVHGLVLLAVPAVLLARTAMPHRRQLQVIGIAVAAIGVAFGTLLLHALRQLPLSALHPGLLVLLGLCAVALAGAYIRIALALWTGRRGAQDTQGAHHAA